MVLLAYADKLEWLKDIDFTSLFSYLVAALFITVLGFRVWDEYGRSKPSLIETAAKRAERERLFDELDAKEALDAEHVKSVPVTPFNNVFDEQSEASQHEVPQPEGAVGNSSQFSTKPEQLDLLGFSTPKKPD